MVLFFVSSFKPESSWVSVVAVTKIALVFPSPCYICKDNLYILLLTTNFMVMWAHHLDITKATKGEG